MPKTQVGLPLLDWATPPVPLIYIPKHGWLSRIKKVEKQTRRNSKCLHLWVDGSSLTVCTLVKDRYQLE